MPKNNRRVRIAGAIAAAMLAASSAAAGAPPAPTVVTAAAGFFVPGAAEYPELKLIVPKGGTVLFVNADAATPPAHSIRSYDVDEHGELLFTSGPSSSLGEASEVSGVEDLAPGDYAFYCHVHTAMNGILTVVEQ